MAFHTEQRIQVLHLVGSPTSEFYFDLSIMDGRTAAECEGLDRTAFEHKFAVVFTDRKWAFPAGLDPEALAAAERMSLPMALSMLSARDPPVDVIVPHMHCQEGMTQNFKFCKMLGIEVLGCPAHACALANDKRMTKEVCRSCGVPVPVSMSLWADQCGEDMEGLARQLLTLWSTPFIVKPATRGNSLGLSLVMSNGDLAAALTKAFRYDGHVLLEEYIAGHECQVAVVEVADGHGGVGLEVLPKIEYLFENVSSPKQGLSIDESGQVLGFAASPMPSPVKAQKDGDRVCPAQLAAEVHRRLDDLARRAHRELNCKYYSLYDFRINEDGFPFLLKARLFGAFSSHCTVVDLVGKTGKEKLHSHPRLFQSFLRRAAAETRALRGPGRACRGRSRHVQRRKIHPGRGWGGP